MRPNKDQTWCEVARVLAKRSTCARRATAAVVVDHYDRMIAAGFNGVGAGLPHCNEGYHCSASAQPNSEASGDSANETTFCKAAHAEQNALIWLPDPRQAASIYCTNLPCFTCAKMILNTSIDYVCAIEDYPDHRGLELLLQKKGMTVRVGDFEYISDGNNGTVRSVLEEGSIL